MDDIPMDEGRPGNGHIEPCRDLKSLQIEIRKLKACVDDVKKRTTPWKVFIGFAGGMVTVAIIFISYQVAALKNITANAVSERQLMYQKFDELTQKVVDVRVNQERFNTIQQRVEEFISESRRGDLPHR